MFRRRLLAWLAGSLVAALLAGCSGSTTATTGKTQGSTPDGFNTPSGSVDPGSSAGDRPAPGFTLTDQFGQRLSLSSLRGKVVLLAFVDSQCTTICPLTTTAMLQAKQLLGAAGDNVALVGIDANPKATAVADVRAYSVAHGMLNEWNFLTGSGSQLAAVWRAYSVYVAVTTTGIDHEPVIYLIDQHGRERLLYITQMAYAAVAPQAEVIARAVAGLLPGRPQVAAVPAPGGTDITPAQPVSLPSATGGPPVRLGPGQAHLVVFFDSWLTETSDLVANLEALNSYAALARARGWPGLVAVDEAPAEVQSGALAALLRALPRPLAYPVAVDTTGRVADGYQVADQPWFDLTSSAGKVLFSNDGWFPLPLLEKAVTKALAR